MLDIGFGATSLCTSLVLVKSWSWSWSNKSLYWSGPISLGRGLGPISLDGGIGSISLGRGLVQ